MVDWAGQTIKITDLETGELVDVRIFAATLLASNYLYVEPFASMALENWIAGRVHAFEFFGGVPKIIVPDNTKTAVSKCCYYEPERRYEPAYFHFTTARVNVDCHFEVLKNWYSAPKHLMGKKADVRYTATAVEALHDGECVAIHARMMKRGIHVTKDEHGRVHGEDASIRTPPNDGLSILPWCPAPIQDLPFRNGRGGMRTCPASLSFDERLGIIVDIEIVALENKRLTRLIREARLRPNACIEDIDYTHARGLDRSVMAGLRTCRWIEERLNVVITGPTGVGKSFMACALGNLACRNGYAARYYKPSRLLSELTLAKADGTYMRVLQRLSKIQTLIIDDFGLADMSTEDSRDLLEILDDRVAARSTIIASQIPLEQWHEALPDPTIADAILDRVIHSAHRIKLTGESMRRILAKPEQKELNNG